MIARIVRRIYNRVIGPHLDVIRCDDWIRGVPHHSHTWVFKRATVWCSGHGPIGGA